mgnify:CR=1 FL=1
MLEVETLEEFVEIGETVAKMDSIDEAYLTECVGCCCHESGPLKFDNASYRIFASYRGITGMPKFKENGHPDTGDNLEIMVVKTYQQPKGIAEDLAQRISRYKAEKVESDELPDNAIVYKLK